MNRGQVRISLTFGLNREPRSEVLGDGFLFTYCLSCVFNLFADVICVDRGPLILESKPVDGVGGVIVRDSDRARPIPHQNYKNKNKIKYLTMFYIVQ